MAELPPPILATRGQNSTSAIGAMASVVSLAEHKMLKGQQDGIVATRGNNRGRKAKPSINVEPVKASKGTWAFRIRERAGAKRLPPVYTARVSDAVYEMIREGDYEQFKKQLISSYRTRAIRSSHGA